MSEHALAVGKTFPWHELYVADTAQAKAFYSEVLGWGIEEYPMGEMGTYTMLQANGKAVAGIMGTNTPQMGHIPAHWAVYVGVDDVDATITKAESLGASVVVPPMDVPNVGRMALLSDPQGAHFWVFKEAAM